MSEHRTALDKIAESLLEHETIEGKHVLEIIEFGEMRSPVTVTAIGKPGEKPAEKKTAEKPASDPISHGAAPAPTPA